LVLVELLEVVVSLVQMVPILYLILLCQLEAEAEEHFQG